MNTFNTNKESNLITFKYLNCISQVFATIISVSKKTIIIPNWPVEWPLEVTGV